MQEAIYREISGTGRCAFISPRELPSIEALDVTQTSRDTVTASDFEGLTRLRFLSLRADDLDDNEFARIPAGIGDYLEASVHLDIAAYSDGRYSMSGLGATMVSLPSLQSVELDTPHGEVDLLRVQGPLWCYDGFGSELDDDERAYLGSLRLAITGRGSGLTLIECPESN